MYARKVSYLANPVSLLICVYYTIDKLCNVHILTREYTALYSQGLFRKNLTRLRLLTVFDTGIQQGRPQRLLLQQVPCHNHSRWRHNLFPFKWHGSRFL